MNSQEVELALQAQLDQQNIDDPPTYNPLWLQGNFRHKCPAQRNVSKAIDLKEIYHTDDSISLEHALLFREGQCKRCKQVARSKVGHLVLKSERPPISGRVARA